MKTALLAFSSLACATIIVAGIWAWTPDRPRNQLERKYWDSATQYMEIGGTSLRVRITGPQDAPAVLLLHGFGSSLETWEPWAQSLSDRYKVVRFDLPGCGLSEADSTGIYGDARSLELVKALLDRLGIEKAVLIGNSMGGRIAWRFAAAFSERTRKLVLISPDGFASPGFQYGKAPQVPAILKLIKYFLPRALLRTNLAAAYGDANRLSDATVDRYYELLLAPGNREAMIKRMQQSVLEEPTPILRQITVPTLLLWGKKDRLIPFSNSADYIRALGNSQLISFVDLGHVPHEEAPAESLAAVAPFLSNEGYPTAQVVASVIPHLLGHPRLECHLIALLFLSAGYGGALETGCVSEPDGRNLVSAYSAVGWQVLGLTHSTAKPSYSTSVSL